MYQNAWYLAILSKFFAVIVIVWGAVELMCFHMLLCTHITCCIISWIDSGNRNGGSDDKAKNADRNYLNILPGK